ncbi:MAG: hypothetical protein PVG78_07865 [Desulfobacterales bacterium]|jgi:hypothetical protein
MNTIKLSLVDSDYAVTCRTCLDLPEKENADFKKFLRDIAAELATGQTAVLEFEDATGEPIAFSLTQNV